jgi:hypothetical protein
LASFSFVFLIIFVFLSSFVSSVRLLGVKEEIKFVQNDTELVITLPKEFPSYTTPVFAIELA